MKTTKTIFAVLVASLILMIPLAAQATVGHFKAIMDTTYTIDESFDGVTDDNYMFGGGLELEFDVWNGLSLGLDYTTRATEGRLYKYYSNEYSIHSPRLSLRWRFICIDWFEPYGLFLVGPDFHYLTMNSVNGERFKTVNRDWQPSFAALVGAQFQLPKELTKDWEPWDDFNFGFFVEVGYDYHHKLKIDHKVEKSADIENSSSTGNPLGELFAGGPIWRAGVFWRF